MFPDGPIFAVLLLLGLAAPFLMWRRPGGKESALIVAIAIVLLAVPLMTTMFDYRYFLPAIPFLGLAGAFGLSAIWTRVPGTGARAALIGAAAIFVGCVSLAFALSAAPAKTAIGPKKSHGRCANLTPQKTPRSRRRTDLPSGRSPARRTPRCSARSRLGRGSK